MKLYEIRTYHRSTDIEKVWIEVEAENKTEAMRLVKAGYGDWIDSKSIAVEDGEFIDMEDWTVTNEEEIKKDGEENGKS